MKVKAVLSAVCFLVLSVGANSADITVMYEKTSSVLKNNGLNSENFLDTKLVMANFDNKLESLYFSSFYEGNTEYDSVSALSAEELNKKIEKQFKSVDFEKIISSVKSDTKAEVLPKKIGSSKIDGLKVRRWSESSRKAAAELKAKKDILAGIKRDFNYFENSYQQLDKTLKVKFYIYLSAAVKSINDGSYGLAKNITAHISKNIIVK